MICFGLSGRDVTDGAEQALIIEPVHPFEGGVFDLSQLEKANTGNDADPDAAAYAEKFNWRSYHPALLVTDPRFGDGAKRSFAEVRNQHAYLLCQATYGNAVTKSKFSKFQRSYIIARGGQIGSQHFGGLWMGDNQSDR